MFTFPLELSTCLYAVLLAAALLVARRIKQQPQLPYPPSPPGQFLLGNLANIPTDRQWVTYARWSQEFNSDVIRLNLAGTNLLIVNTYEATVELFEKRSAIYSNRPRMPMLIELMGWDWAFTFQPYGPKWRAHRRLFHQYFNANVVSQYHHIQLKAVHELLQRLVEEPDNFIEHLRLMAASLIMNLGYGIDVQSLDNPYMVLVEKAMDALAEVGRPGAFMVDGIHSLKHVPEWFPGAGFKRKAREWRKPIREAAYVPYQYAKDQMAKGTGAATFVSTCLENWVGKHDEESEDTIRGVSAAMYTAGADTSVASLCTFILAMVLNPDVVKKAQEELDRVVGDRLPEFADEPSLPYISAVIMEVARWHPVAPLAVPHSSMAEDIYNGMRMPAGAILMANTWAILHDEKMYPEPSKFNPDRFLLNGKLNPAVRPPDVGFGYGRRFCPGKPFAGNTAFITVASVLSLFDVSKALDDQGKEITPPEAFSAGPICRPLPFKCSIKLRSPRTADLVSEAYALHRH